jgi:hypothetical protein
MVQHIDHATGSGKTYVTVDWHCLKPALLFRSPR